MKLSLLCLVLVFRSIRVIISHSCPNGDSKMTASPGKPQMDHYNIILMGATGDLAGRYLWRALYDIFQRQYLKDVVHFQIYAASRKDPDAARRQISRRLLALVDCDDVVVKSADPDCIQHKTKFIEAVQFQQLKSERDFQTLAEKLYENTQSVYGIEPGSPNSFERGRLVYMSIPPSTYSTTAKYIDKYLRPKIGRPWMRIIIEKPFGHDLESAKALANELSQYFTESELYRVDHYLAKTTVKQILPFRYVNRDLYEPLWNRDYIDRVDIVLKEKEDVSGRTSFYNEVGVIRDVMQNHLTEMLALVAQELPYDSGNVTSLLNSKNQLLNDLHFAGRYGAVLTGQYSKYNVEWLSQLKENNITNPSNPVTQTPTYAAVVLNVNNNRWRNVPFVLISGKKLDEKATYIRIHFRQNRFCLKDDEANEMCDGNQEIIFRVGDGTLYKSQIAVSRSLPRPKRPPTGWSELSDPAAADTMMTLFGQPAENFVQHVSRTETTPYVELIEAAMNGAKYMFVSTDSLLASWKVWTDVLNEAEKLQPRQYLGQGKDSERLDVFVARVQGAMLGPVLRYWVNEVNVAHYNVVGTLQNQQQHQFSQVSDQFRNAALVSGTTEHVVAELTNEIVRRVDVKMQISNKEPFHIALSGGTSPHLLMQQLATKALPWKQIHIWLVDERCDGSNFVVLEQYFLSQIPSGSIPHGNIHPVLRDYCSDACSADSSCRADVLYQSAMERLITNASFDVIVLGLGTDGHTASLFPGQQALDENEKFVTLAHSRGTASSVVELPDRITLTFKAINQAQFIAVLVLGTSKHSILQQVSDITISDVKRYPIVGVNVTLDRVLSWYVDNDAMFGH